MAYYLPISPAELTLIQQDAVAATLSLPCEVQRKAMALDGMGQATETFTTISAANLLVGMAEPTQTQLQNFDYLIGTLAAWLVKFPVNQDLLPQDHLIVAGQRLVVQVLLAPRSYPGLLTVLASEIKGGA